MSNEAIRPVPPESPTQAQISAAKEYGQEHGYTAHADGWIYNAKGRAIARDWQNFASYLIAMGVKKIRNETEES
jgi:hypothetical protein